MKKENVGNDDWLHSLRRARANPIQYAGSHKAAVGFSFGTPDHAGETYHGTPDEDRTTPKIGGDRNPQKIGKSEDQDTHSGLRLDIFKKEGITN